MEWEDKVETEKTWTNCKTFFKNYYQLKKRYSNARPGKYRFESAANVNEQAHTNKYEGTRVPQEAARLRTNIQDGEDNKHKIRTLPTTH